MTAPRLTVVVASRTGLAESRPVLEHLRGQTIAAAMEVILVAKRGQVRAEELGAIGGVGSLRLVEVDRVVNRGEAAACGLLQASAPFAGPCENHAFADPDTYEKLITDRDASDAAVSPTMRTANPETRRSLAMYLTTYWHAGVPADPAPRDTLPLHNGVWRTELLRELGDRLPELMSDESRLHAEARRRGLKLRIRPDAVTWHVNETRWTLALSIPFFLSMRFGASRSLGWTGIKRLVYALAVPVIGVMHLRTLLARATRLADTKHRVAWVFPMLALTAAASALGESWGHLFPSTPVPAHMEEHEFHLLQRLAGTTPTAPWLREIVAGLRPDPA